MIQNGGRGSVDASVITVFYKQMSRLLLAKSLVVGLCRNFFLQYNFVDGANRITCHPDRSPGSGLVCRLEPVGDLSRLVRQRQDRPIVGQGR